MSAANPLREAALQAAARGWHVFPLRPHAKTPSLEGDWAAHATTDPDQIRDWWNDNPRRNIAIATGLSGLLVIDIDIEHRRTGPQSAPPAAEKLLSRLSAITGDSASLRTFAVQTPSGGAHFYYHAPTAPELGCSVGRIAPSIDSRGRGGYVVAAGSRTRAGTYRVIDGRPVAELPAPLVELLVPPAPQSSSNLAPGHPSAYLAAIVADETRRVANPAPHTRNLTLFDAAVTLGRLVAAGELTEQHVRTQLTAAAIKHVGIDGFTHAELDRAITNGLAYGAHRPRYLASDR
ncbi:bifunctional DNA primase/polymerase [Nocardia sp. CS682]|uniref:bifunctional DNA primase/polymerase n=1 Tax=Nocardia sp. CS682 TaxID=1047172 RepID=UPI0014322CE4|nr:bifunctional DNA primase/polymerase [Nocardia sp. CS682]